MAEPRSGVEVERRFLVRGDAWSVSSPDGERYIQGYLSTSPQRTVRIRLAGDRACLTVKGRAVNGAKPEIECDIPLQTARAILTHPASLCIGDVVEKTRTTISLNGLTWEIDVFAGANEGLVIAEVEYHGDGSNRRSWEAQVDAQRPAWVGLEVTGDSRFSNSRLAERPFSDWPAEERRAVLRQIAG